MSQIGSLVVFLEASIDRFTLNMNQAAQQAAQSMERIQAAADAARGGLAGPAAVALVAAGALAVLVKGSIDAADNLRDMSQKTGIAVEDLSGLGFAAGQAGGSLESMVGAAGKLNKAISEAAGGNKETGAAFKALGIDVLDASGNLKKADVVMAEVADQFAKYEDGPEKAALALRILGKSGADMIPLLNDGGDAMRENVAYAKQYSGATTDLSNAADNFNDTMGKMTIQQRGFANTMAESVLPILQAVADEMLGAAEQSNKFSLAADVVRTTLETFVVVGSEVGYVFKAVGTEIGGIFAQLERAAHFDMKGFNAISEAMKEDAARAREEHDKFIFDILNRAPPSGPDPFGPNQPNEQPKKKPAPRLSSTVDDDAKDARALARKQMEGNLRAIEAGMERERATAKYHEQYMEELRAQGLVDYQTQADYKRRAAADSLAATTKAYDAEIAVLAKYKTEADKESERQDAQNKIDELVAKKEKARQESVQSGAMATLGLSKAQSELNIQMREWVIQQDLAAGQLQFEIDMMGRSSLEVAKLADARRIELDVEERIRQARKNGDVSDETAARIRSDAAIAKARSGALIQVAYDRGRDPWLNMQESIRKYGEEAADTGAQIGSAMTNGLKSAEDAFVQFTMTGKGSFSDLTRSIMADMVRIQAQKAISGLGSMVFGSLFGATGAFGSNAGVAASQGLTMADIGGAFANGGDPPVGVPSLVGERGPELFVPKSHGTIVPNGRFGLAGGANITYAPTINIDSRTDQAQVRQLVAGAVAQGNANLVDRLQRSGAL